MEQGIKENLVASGVDIGSIIFAYSLGVHNLNILFGLGYAAFDAWIVIWQRGRLTRWMGSAYSHARGVSNPVTSKYLGKVLWDRTVVGVPG
jgi:hypothetical protein